MSPSGLVDTRYAHSDSLYRELKRVLSKGPWRVISLEPKGRRDGGALKSSSARKNSAWVIGELSPEPGVVADDGAFKSSSGRENPAWVVVELSLELVEVNGGEAGSTRSCGSGAMTASTGSCSCPEGSADGAAAGWLGAVSIVGLCELSLVEALSISLSLSTGAGQADGEE